MLHFPLFLSFFPIFYYFDQLNDLKTRQIMIPVLSELTQKMCSNVLLTSDEFHCTQQCFLAVFIVL